MEIKRLWQTFRLWTCLGSYRRMEYLKKHKVFHHIGQNSTIMDRKVPLYANLISIGDNVQITSNVSFVTHDIVHAVLNGYQQNSNNGKDNQKSFLFKEKIGCIQVGNNVFIGTGTIITCDVRIGDNVIIGAGSVVTKDVPSGVVVAGAPLKKICSIEEFCEKRRIQQESHNRPFDTKRQRIDKQLEDWMWKQFKADHSDK